ITEEKGRAVPILTETQSYDIVVQMLRLLASSILIQAGRGDDLVNIDPELSRIPGPGGRKAFTQIRRDGIWDRLLDEDPLNELLEGLSQSFVLFAVVDARAGERRIIKYGYTHQFARS